MYGRMLYIEWWRDSNWGEGVWCLWYCYQGQIHAQHSCSEAVSIYWCLLDDSNLHCCWAL